MLERVFQFFFVCMMSYHFYVMNEHFKDNYSLLYSDTDSLVYEIRNNDVYEWMKNNKKYFDLSDINNPKMKWLKDNTNKKNGMYER